jgi:uncharacterized protein (TIGR03437 family)
MLARWIAFSLSFAAIAYPQQLARDFFDDTVIHDVRIDMDPNDWAALQATYLENTYYQADVASGGVSAVGVGIRSRGRGSRSAAKPNFDVNVNKFVKKLTFADLGFFVLKANNQDGSLMHEVVTFKLFRKMGLPAPREAPARVFINGQYLGFYMIVEHEDEDFLTRNLGEDKGDLFEWKPTDYFYFEDRGTDPAAYTAFLDPKTNEDTPDYQKFVDLIQAVNHSSDADFVSAVSRYLDLKLYLTHAAIENATAELDGIWGDTYGTNNIYLYRFEGQDLFNLFVWDKDLTFLQPQREVFQGAAKNVLARRLLAIPEYRTFYLSQLSKAVDLMGGAGGWADREVSRLYALMRADAVDDPHKQCIQTDGSIGPCGPGAFEQGVQNMHAFLAVRQTYVRNELAGLGYKPATSAPQLDRVSLESVSGGSELVPGSLARIRGVGFGGDVTASGDTLPRSNGRSFVALDGVRAGIVSLGASEAIVQVPWDLQPGSAPVAIAVNGTLSNTVDAPVVPAAPVIQAIVHQDGSAVTPENPAARGEVLAIYATGLGAVEPNVKIGETAPLDTTIRTADTPTIQVAGEPASVLFSGLSPGSVGLYQINVVIPASVPAGTATLTVGASGRSTSTAVLIH